MKKFCCILLFMQFCLLHAAVSWFPALNVSATSLTIDNPRVGVADNGKAVAIWLRTTGADVIQASNFNGSTWSTPVDISTSGLSFLNSPELAVNAEGKAIAIWAETTGTPSVQVAHFNGVSWDSPIDLEAVVAALGLPDIAMNKVGKAVAIWENGTSLRVKASFFNGTSWSSHVAISGDLTSQLESFPAVGIDKNGNALAVWFNVGDSAVRASRFNGSSWSFPQTLAITTNNSVPQMAVNEFGKAVAVWVDTALDVIRAIYFNGQSWETVQTISNSGTSLLNPQISINSSGIAFAVWADGINDIFSARFNGSTWDAPLTVSTEGGGGGDDTPQISVDPNGRAVALWESSDSRIAASSYSGNSWSALVNISTNGQTIGNRRLGTDTQGNPIAVWDNASVGAVQAAQGAQIDTLHFHGMKVIEQFPTQTDEAIVVGWTVLNNISSFKIFRDAGLTNLAFQTTNGVFEEHQLPPGSSRSYSIVLVNGNSDEITGGRITLE